MRKIQSTGGDRQPTSQKRNTAVHKDLSAFRTTAVNTKKEHGA